MKLRFFLLLLISFSSSSLYASLEALNIYHGNNLEYLASGIVPRSSLYSKWVGNKKVKKDLSILVLAGHADSQGLSGAGTLGEAVSRFGADPMNPEITDELFWNLLVRDEVTRLGKIRGLNINSYEPIVRNIVDEDDPRTNWSVGAEHVRQGGYSIEIHFDSYGKYGAGGGLIPPLFIPLNLVDENLARSFGRFPILFRGGLGAPRRNIRILEIAKLEGELERKLRDLKTRDKMISLISIRIVDAFAIGLGFHDVFNPTLDEEDTFLPAIYL